MIRRRLVVFYVLLLCLLASFGLWGCRAFQPEVVIVNKRPETFIIGAPAETSGGYFHFHLYWYGSDQDGEVVKFVWALTDTSVQNHQQLGDEEDQRFNPATNASTLSIGHYTSRTDTVFDFQINRGSSESADRTFHLVAIDDRGDFDRTPARMRFVSNALGTPDLIFYKSYPPQADQRYAKLDTIGYGQRFTVAWQGVTPNLRTYEPALLAQRDTIPPVDGLLGYKFRIVDVPCNDGTEDCWQPRNFDAATGDSVSYFYTIDHLDFYNDDSGLDPRRKRLTPGVHEIRVNTLDIAGVEARSDSQRLSIVLNYDPQTRILRNETDPLNPEDTKVYPYYVIFKPDHTTEEHTFAEGDTVPDRAYVVFKAIGWDDSRDLRLTSDFDVQFQAQFEAVGLYQGEARFPFATQFSALHRTPAWEDLGAGAADTIGFLAGPFEYTVTMRTSDEHGKRDGTPDRFHFYGNRPPCVECVEMLVGADQPSPNGTYGRYDAACQARVDTIYASAAPAPVVPPTWRRASLLAQGLYWYNARTDAVWLDEPTSTVAPDSMPGWFFEYKLALHGSDDVLEPWNADRPQDRVKAWRYTVKSDRDPGNLLSEGGGIDNIEYTTYDWALYDPLASPPQPIAIDDEGVWILRFKFFVPTVALFAGEAAYLTNLRDILQLPDYQKVFELTTLQLGPNEVTVQSVDARTCAADPERGMYHYYRSVRVPQQHGMSCTLKYGDAGEDVAPIRLSDYAYDSELFTKRFVIKVVPTTGPVFP